MLTYPTQKTLLAGFIALLLSFALQAKEKGLEKLPKFFQITPEEAQMLKYPGDPDAHAAILLDEGDVVIENGEILYTHRVRIKVFDHEGLDWADVKIPFYKKDASSKEMVQRIEGATFNWNASTGKVDKEKLVQKDVEAVHITGNWYEKVFPMPKVVPGSVIEYRYVLKSPYLQNLVRWQFQYEIPVKHSRFTTTYPPTYEYQNYQSGLVKIDFHDRTADGVTLTASNGIPYQLTRNTWEGKRIPAFHREPFMTANSDYLSAVDFQLTRRKSVGGISIEVISSWKKLVSELLETDAFKRNPGNYMAAAGLAAAGANDLQDLEKAKAVYNHVRKVCSWDGTRGILPDHKAKNFVVEKKGSAADLCFYLVDLLREAGFTAYPVLASTRTNGKVNAGQPKLDAFNNLLTLVNVGQATFLLDPTSETHQFGFLPKNCLNGNGLVVKENPFWVPLDPGIPSTAQNQVVISRDAETDEFIAQVRATYSGEVAKQHRIASRDSEDKLKELIGVTDIRTLDVQSSDDPEKPLSVVYTAPAKVEDAGDLLLLTPFEGEEFATNPFTATNRDFPVDYAYKRMHTFMLNFQIPEGYEVSEVPADASATLTSGKVAYAYQVQTMPGISVQIIFRIVMKETAIPATEYTELKALYEGISTKFAEPLVLMRKE